MLFQVWMRVVQTRNGLSERLRGIYEVWVMSKTADSERENPWGVGLALALSACVLSLVLFAAPSRIASQDDATRWGDVAGDFLSRPMLAHAENEFDRFIATDGALSLANLSSFDAAHFETASETMRQRQCLAEAIFYEARSERVSGQMAVAEVVMNRVNSRHYPNSICGVVYQGSERRTGCQFSFTCDGSMDVEPYGRGWERSVDVADHIMMGFARPLTSRATHYHTVAVDPIWNDTLVRTRRIGSHIFYRIPNRSERMLLPDRGA